MTQPLSPLTLMAVHAHPDDEASSTGGVLAKYSDEGVRTIVVTCTNGEFGDGPSGTKPGEEGHDPGDVAQIRLAELRESCKHLGVTELETLGYHDSGMPEWNYKDNPEAFCNVPLEAVVDRIAGLIEKYQPAIVITYDPDGAYQHPDHVHAARAAIGAVEKSGIPAKLYLTAMRRSGWQKIAEALRAAGEHVDDWEITEEEAQNMRESEALITTTIDINSVLDRKRAALLTHASQIADSWFSKIPPDVAAEVFGQETFILKVNKANASVPETDLLSGLS
ncbi:MAG TPA: PIG-L family deacetylase [Streptosporangiaceae bacterium]|jgi:LmbE family N-acetylglucosaminyl deacetylase|nr:PIG-L family deacetylase [Streptosporangiaceae bacterium]